MAHSATGRLAVMALLTLFLMVPMTLVDSLVGERTGRRDEAAREIGESWGGAQTLSGPVLVVPYTQSWTDEHGRQQGATGQAYFLPTDLRMTAELRPQSRKRGIFEVIVYETTVTMEGHFIRPALDWLRPSPSEIRWGDAVVAVGVADPRALTRRATLTMTGAGTGSAFAGGAVDVGLFSAGIHAAVPSLGEVAAGESLPFAFTLDVNGTREVRFLPSAEETTIALSSTWPHASFVGARLPQSRTTGAGGFTAQWHVPDVGRPFASRWAGASMNREQLAAQAATSTFGVDLSQPVDVYQQTERSVKYAVLFIVLTFMVFFMWELFRATLLHPMHYVFVGFALCVFYVLLLSLSEHVGFDTAYGSSATATSLLISGYAGSVLDGWRRGGSVAAALSALYGFLYLLLRLEDYALLAGAVGLFVMLALVMFLTRRMNWYELKLGRKTA